MVVIEPVATGEDCTNDKIPVPKPVKDHISSSTATNMLDDSLRGGDAGYTSDGFETASETDFNDEDERKEGEKDIEKSNEGYDFKIATEASSKGKEEQQCREQNLELEENKEEKALAEANLVKMKAMHCLKLDVMKRHCRSMRVLCNLCPMCLHLLKYALCAMQILLPAFTNW